MSERDDSRTEEASTRGAWLRAVGFATTTPDPSEALPGLLAEAAGAAGAEGGAVLEREASACRWSWGVECARIEPLLEEGGVVREALRRQEEWVDELLPLSVPAAGGASRPMLLVPLRVRGVANGALLLVFPPGAPPPRARREAAAAFAGLIALVLENDRLYEEARHALQSRDHFLVALNHELRTPASALVLNAELLRTGTYGSLSPRLESVLQDTENQVRELVGVLQRVLDLGRLGSQATPDRPDIVQPRELVTELLRRVEPAAKRKQLSITVYLPRNLPPVQTDSARFSRILLQLFSNAIKYTSRGGIEVRIERGTRTVGHGRQEPVLVVRVRDTGRGIPPEELPRVFEPFTQVEEGARTDSGHRGVGLGLPLARSLARSLGGDVTVESVPGDGTTASLVLPYRQDTVVG